MVTKNPLPGDLMRTSVSSFAALWWLSVLAVAPAKAETIVLASTTSLQDSGLFTRILPRFTAETGIDVHVLAQGSGQALATAARGDADLVLVHDPDAEERFIAEGHVSDRRQI